MEETILNFAIPIRASVEPTAPAWKAWRLMKKNGVCLLPVIASADLVGIVTHQDILRFANQNGGQSQLVKEIMRSEPLLVNVHKTVKEVINLMVAHKKEYAVIIDDSGKFHGVYNWTDAMQMALNHG